MPRVARPSADGCTGVLRALDCRHLPRAVPHGHDDSENRRSHECVGTHGRIPFVSSRTLARRTTLRRVAPAVPSSRTQRRASHRRAIGPISRLRLPATTRAAQCPAFSLSRFQTGRVKRTVATRHAGGAATSGGAVEAAALTPYSPTSGSSFRNFPPDPPRHWEAGSATIEYARRNNIAHRAICASLVSCN